MIVHVVEITKKKSFRVLCKCDECKKEYIELYSQIKHEKHHFCGPICYGNWCCKNRAGELNPFYGKKHTDIFKRNHSKNRTGSGGPNWKGGKKINTKGYICIYKPEHPFSNEKYVVEHRLVMEEFLGRYLKPEETVHHINGIVSDNRIENLMLFDNRAEHTKYHAQLKTA